MKSYKHLTQEQRYHISALHHSGCSGTFISQAVGVHKSTISRELKLGSSDRGYGPVYAHQSAELRHNKGAFARRFDSTVWSLVIPLLLNNASPEQISGRLFDEIGFRISHETIYRFILVDKESGGVLYKHLRCQKKRKKRYGAADHRGKIKEMVSIDKRPPHVETRSKIGHWEGDTMTGKDHQGTIITEVERKSRFLVAGKAASKHADIVTKRVIELLKPHKKKKKVKSTTKDQGTEFSGHKEVAEALGIDVYFAHAHCPWERGTNENTNGLLRQYFPKKMDLRKVSEEELHKAVNELNHRPRKVLGFKSPYEVFYGKKMRYVASTAAVALQI